MPVWEMSVTKTILDRYLSLDTDYGTQAHQAAFSRRMLRLQELEPCSRDHTDDCVEIRQEDGSKKVIVWSTHTSKCYSQETVERVRREELS
jgi:L-rhamnose isomerase